MSIHDILGIASVVCWIAVVIAMLYYRSKGDVIEMISHFISLAEQSGMPGPDKMAMVVNWMYTALPAPFRTILTKERLQVIAQEVFDWTRQYAVNYLESHKKPTVGNPADPEEDEGDDTFVEETNVIPEICEACENEVTDLFVEADKKVVPENCEACVDDACPIFPEDQKE